MKPTDEQLKDPGWWRDNDPSGGEATHYDFSDETNHAWMRKSDSGSWCCWGRKNWINLGSKEPHPGWKIIPRPTAWQGEGFPPVGVRCMGKRQGEDYEEGCIKYSSDKLIVWEFSSSGEEIALRPGSMDFKPLRTKEEVERDETIEAAARELGEICPLPEVLNGLYDAGMLRKPMSREEAFKKLNGYYNHHHINVVLDALGF